MHQTYRKGDWDNHCLTNDRNRDVIFAGPGDISLDWVDNNSDGVANMQVVVGNSNYIDLKIKMLNAYFHQNRSLFEE